jgi:LPXTG-site transpeptidase (sortase) family protein
MTTLVRSVWYERSGEVASSTLAALAPSRQALPGELPARLRIPVLNLQAVVKHVGVDKNGLMATPGNFSDTGWYKYGTVPGFMGSAVIDGHVDNALALDGVFKRLGELTVGDEVFVDTASSTPLRFVVVEVASYPKDEVPRERLFGAEDRAYLNLITCDGAWIQGQKTYDRRLVVWAELTP